MTFDLHTDTGFLAALRAVFECDGFDLIHDLTDEDADAGTPWHTGPRALNKTGALIADWLNDKICDDDREYLQALLDARPPM